MFSLLILSTYLSNFNKCKISTLHTIKQFELPYLFLPNNYIFVNVRVFKTKILEFVYYTIFIIEKIINNVLRGYQYCILTVIVFVLYL